MSHAPRMLLNFRTHKKSSPMVLSFILSDCLPEFCYYTSCMKNSLVFLLITLNMLISNLFFNFLCGSRIEPDWYVNGLTHFKEVEHGEPGVCEINFADKIPLCLPASWYCVCPFLFTGIFGIFFYFDFPARFSA